MHAYILCIKFFPEQWTICTKRIQLFLFLFTIFYFVLKIVAVVLTYYICFRCMTHDSVFSSQEKNFISFLDIHAFYQQSPPSAYWGVRKDGKKKVGFAFPSPPAHHFQHKDMTGFLGPHVSQNSIAFFLHWKWVLVQKASVASLVCYHRCSTSPDPPHSLVDAELSLFWLWVLLTSHALWVPWSSVLMGHHRHYMQMEQQEMAAGTHTAQILSAHRHAPLFHRTSLAKPKFKNKITQNFKTVTAEH